MTNFKGDSLASFNYSQNAGPTSDTYLCDDDDDDNVFPPEFLPFKRYHENYLPPMGDIQEFERVHDSGIPCSSGKPGCISYSPGQYGANNCCTWNSCAVPRKYMCPNLATTYEEPATRRTYYVRRKPEPQSYMCHTTLNSESRYQGSCVSDETESENTDSISDECQQPSCVLKFQNTLPCDDESECSVSENSFQSSFGCEEPVCPRKVTFEEGCFMSGNYHDSCDRKKESDVTLFVRSESPEPLMYGEHTNTGGYRNTKSSNHNIEIYTNCKNQSENVRPDFYSGSRQRKVQLMAKKGNKVFEIKPDRNGCISSFCTGTESNYPYSQSNCDDGRVDELVQIECTPKFSSHNQELAGFTSKCKLTPAKTPSIKCRQMKDKKKIEFKKSNSESQSRHYFIYLGVFFWYFLITLAYILAFFFIIWYLRNVSRLVVIVTEMTMFLTIIYNLKEPIFLLLLY